MNSITLKDLQKFAKKYLVNKNYISSILLNPKDAARLKLKDTSKDLMKKHAVMWNDPNYSRGICYEENPIN